MMAAASLEGNGKKLLAIHMRGAMARRSALSQSSLALYVMRTDGCHRLLTQHCVTR